MSPLRLTEDQLDTFKEISNIGVGHAATALSQLLGQKVMLRVPRITLADIGQVPALLGGAEKLMAGVTLQVLGDARGNILLVFPQESVSRLLTSLLGSADKGLVLSELGASTLREVGNILASAYLNALGKLLRLCLIPSIPLLAYDTAGAVIDQILIQLSRSEDQVLLVETEFASDDPHQGSIQGHFLLLPDAESLEVFLQAVGTGCGR
jgi:chemotaxis protein CheC